MKGECETEVGVVEEGHGPRGRKSSGHSITNKIDTDFVRRRT